MGTNYMIATYAENLIGVVDLEHEEEKFKMLYNEFADIMQINIQWKLGAQVAFPQYIVTNF